MRTIRVNECVECEEYIGLSFDREERSGLLHCYKSSAPTPRQSLRRSLQAGEREGFLRKLHQRADCTPVSRIMSLNVQCVTEDVSLPALAACLLDGGYSGAPVVDYEGTPVGVVSKTDLLRHGVTPDGRVKDIMTSMSFTLHEDQTVSNASALMAYEGIHRLPVVDVEGKVVGLLSSLDILHWLACKTGNTVPAPRSRRDRN
jgi:CBS domain-containing protein